MLLDEKRFQGPLAHARGSVVYLHHRFRTTTVRGVVSNLFSINRMPFSGAEDLHFHVSKCVSVML
jgi:hypothetical protein